MTSRRVQKAAAAIRQVVSMAILTELKDPRVQNVTVTRVEVSGDMRESTVHVSVMGDDAQQRLSLTGLKAASGFLQAKVAERIETRYTPRLKFQLDRGVKNSIEVARILHEVLPAEAATSAEEGDEFGDVQADDVQTGDVSEDLSDESLPDPADRRPPAGSQSFGDPEEEST